VISDEREILIPDIPDIIEKVDVDAGEIVINPMQGLLD
jgi:ribosomal 30S subunit maturation factor RimM